MFKLRKGPKNYEDIQYTCTIRFLDDSEPITVTFQKEHKGAWLIEYVCKELNLVERDYFGLRFVDVEKQRHWLDPFKPVYRQLKHVNPMVLCFRVKFYPTEPMRIKEEITRYFLFLQLRRDLHHGRLLCSQSDANQLAAYIVQSEIGDYDPQDHGPDYIKQFKMLPKQTGKHEEKIAELHKNLAGQVPSEAEANFIKKACTLDTYGVDPHPVKPRVVDAEVDSQDQKTSQMYLGVTHLGIVTFQGNKRTHLFKWSQINKIAFEGKMFIVHVTIAEGEEKAYNIKRAQNDVTTLSLRGSRLSLFSDPKAPRSGGNLLGCASSNTKKHACGFKCPTFSACKHLWKCAVEQQYFFTLNSSADAPKVTSGGGLFTRGSKFRFRCASNPPVMRSYHKARSTSMPLKLRDKAREADKVNGDVVVVENHAPPLDRPASATDIHSVPGTQLRPEVAPLTELAADNGVTVISPVYTAVEPPDDPLSDNPEVREVTAYRVTEPLSELPEEAEVTLAEDDYDPMLRSPSSEEFPIGMTRSPADYDLHAHTLPRTKKNPRSADVDYAAMNGDYAQAQDLLDSAPAGNHVVTAAEVSREPDVDVTEAPPVEEVDKSDRLPHVEQNHVTSHDLDTGQTEVRARHLDSASPPPIANHVMPPAVVTSQPSGGRRAAVCAAVVLSAVAALALLVVFGLLLLESETQLPLLRELRALQGVRNFKLLQYDPLKAALAQRLGLSQR